MTLRKKTKNILSTLFRFGFSAALLTYLYHQIDVDKTIEVVKSADLTYIFYAILLFMVINFIILIRWAIFIQALQLHVPFRAIVRYFFIGLFGNLFLPSAIGGDVIKIIGLCRYTPSKAKVVASVILDRLSGFAGMVMVAIIAFIFGYRLISDFSLLISILCMAFVSGGIASVLLIEKIYAFFCKIFSPFPNIKQALMNVHYDLALIKDRRDSMYQAIGMACFCQILLAATFFLVAKALHQDVKLIYFLIFVPMICVASALPSIGGLGVREAGTAYLLAKVGVASGVAVSISLINFLFMVLVGLVGGVFYAVTKSPDLLHAKPPLSVKNSVP